MKICKETDRMVEKGLKTLKMLTKPNHKKMMIIFDNNDKPLADNMTNEKGDRILQ